MDSFLTAAPNLHYISCTFPACAPPVGPAVFTVLPQPVCTPLWGLLGHWYSLGRSVPLSLLLTHIQLASKEYFCVLFTWLPFVFPWTRTVFERLKFTALTIRAQHLFLFYQFTQHPKFSVCLHHNLHIVTQFFIKKIQFKTLSHASTSNLCDPFQYFQWSSVSPHYCP